MAYISAEEIDVIRKDLKAAFPYVKFSIVGRHSSTVSVRIVAAPFNFYDSKDASIPPRDRDVNSYYISQSDEDYHVSRAGTVNSAIYGGNDLFAQPLGDHEAYVFLRAVKDIITKKWWDKSDSMSDYFHTAFYYDISIGKWDKPFIKTEWPVGVEHLKDPEPQTDLERLGPSLEAAGIAVIQGTEMRSVTPESAEQSLLAKEFPEMALAAQGLMNLSIRGDQTQDRPTDVHAEKASELFGIPVNQLTPDQRRLGKIANFSEHYGGKTSLTPAETEDIVRQIQQEFGTAAKVHPTFAIVLDSIAPVGSVHKLGERDERICWPVYLKDANRAGVNVAAFWNNGSVEQAMAKGWAALTEEDEKRFEAEHGYPVEEYASRLADGTY